MMLTATQPYTPSRPFGAGDAFSPVAGLRMARVEHSDVSQSVYQFNSEVEEFLLGNGDLETLKDKARIAFRELWDGADAAYGAGKLQPAAYEVVEGTVRQVRQAFVEGMTSMESGVNALEKGGATHAEIVSGWRKQLSALQTFWEKNILTDAQRPQAS